MTTQVHLSIPRVSFSQGLDDLEILKDCFLESVHRIIMKSIGYYVSL